MGKRIYFSSLLEVRVKHLVPGPAKIFVHPGAGRDPGLPWIPAFAGNTRRAIDFHEGDNIDEDTLKSLIRAAVTLNQSKPRR